MCWSWKLIIPGTLSHNCVILTLLFRHEGDNVAIIEERISKVNGDSAVRKYAKGRMLGKGGFAKCYEVTNLENKKVLAAKIIQKSSLTKSRARQKVNTFWDKNLNDVSLSLKSRSINHSAIQILLDSSMCLKIKKMFTSF